MQILKFYYVNLLLDENRFSYTVYGKIIFRDFILEFSLSIVVYSKFNFQVLCQFSKKSIFAQYKVEENLFLKGYGFG